MSKVGATRTPFERFWLPFAGRRSTWLARSRRTTAAAPRPTPMSPHQPQRFGCTRGLSSGPLLDPIVACLVGLANAVEMEGTDQDSDAAIVDRVAAMAKRAACKPTQILTFSPREDDAKPDPAAEAACLQRLLASLRRSVAASWT